MLEVEKRYTHELIIDKSAVSRKKAKHKHENSQPFVFLNNVYGKNTKQQTVTNVSEHDSKKKWKSYYKNNSRVKLLITRNSIGINYLLIIGRENIGLYIRWGNFIEIINDVKLTVRQIVILKNRVQFVKYIVILVM